MKVEVRDYTYEEMPDYCDEVEGAREIRVTRDEIGCRYVPDVVYDVRGDVRLRLQLIVPYVESDPERRFPCVVFVQGSAWMQQEIYHNVVNVGKLAQRGYVCAIVEYRHSGIARFPAQVIDAKNAVRFLKKHHEEYHIFPDEVILMGDSSGGHTSAVAGMTAGTDLLDEPVYDTDCRVRGIIDLYGAVEVTCPYGYPTTKNHQLPDSPEGMLMGFDIRKDPERAKAANALTYVPLDYPPVLILHGTKDRTVFCELSVRLYRAMKAAGKDVELYLVRGSDHGGPGFWLDGTVDIYDRFIQRCLGTADHSSAGGEQ